jgi:hypothetical protein
MNFAQSQYNLILAKNLCLVVDFIVLRADGMVYEVARA